MVSTPGVPLGTPVVTLAPRLSMMMDAAVKMPPSESSLAVSSNGTVEVCDRVTGTDGVFVSTTSEV